MKVIRTIAEVKQEAQAARADGKTIGWVGTSGALHEGHLSLVRHAGSENDLVMMFWTGEMAFPWTQKSNPSYPRDNEKDSAMAAAGGVDILYIPNGAEIYPEPPVTSISTPSLYREGLTDPDHLKVVGLFMTKFLNIIGGCSCYMGEKDWQQLVMMRQITRDLSLPVDRFVVSPTVRAEDGVPLSSRNMKLTPENRELAVIVPQSLAAAASAIAAGERDASKIRDIISNTLEAVAPVVYAKVLTETLQDIEILDGPIRLLACADFGGVEILDSLGVEV
ncbi:MAG: Pantoate--beta-alanine ligase [Pseudonocardiales bacterium]|nr:Pantoate--beta-alanine ligase [Pseudonocardiales bacterium]